MGASLVRTCKGYKGYKGYKDGLQPESLADGNWLVKQNQPVLNGGKLGAHLQGQEHFMFANQPNLTQFFLNVSAYIVFTSGAWTSTDTHIQMQIHIHAGLCKYTYVTRQAYTRMHTHTRKGKTPPSKNTYSVWVYVQL